MIQVVMVAACHDCGNDRRDELKRQVERLERESGQFGRDAETDGELASPKRLAQNEKRHPKAAFFGPPCLPQNHSLCGRFVYSAGKCFLEFLPAQHTLKLHTTRLHGVLRCVFSPHHAAFDEFPLRVRSEQSNPQCVRGDTARHQQFAALSRNVFHQAQGDVGPGSLAFRVFMDHLDPFQALDPGSRSAPITFEAWSKDIGRPLRQDRSYEIAQFHGLAFCGQRGQASLEEGVAGERGMVGTVNRIPLFTAIWWDAAGSRRIDI
jgi:hypothetical protein